MYKSVALPGFHLPNILGFFNPFTYFKDQMLGLVQQEIGLFEKAIIHPPPEPSYALQSYLYGNALGLAGRLSVLISLAILSITAIYYRASVRASKALIAAAVVALAGPMSFGFADQMVSFGTTLASTAEFYHSGQQMLQLPNFAGVIGAIISSSVIFGLGGLVVMVFFSYAMLIVAVKVLLLPALAMWPLGERARKFLNWVIALGLVSMVFGRVGAIVCLELGKMFSALFQHLGFGWMGQTFVICVSFLLTLAVQALLLYVTLKTVDNVTGSLDSRVVGFVRTRIEREPRTSQASITAANAANHNPVPVVMVNRREHQHPVRDLVVGTAIAAAASPVAAAAAQSTMKGSNFVAHAAHKIAHNAGGHPDAVRPTQKE